MSFGKPNISLSDVPAIVTAEPYTVSKTIKGLFLLFVLIGVISFLLIVTSDAKHAWTIFHVNFMYWLVLSAASSGFSAVFQICNAQWARPLVRQFEAASGYFFYAIIPLVIIYLFHGFENIFLWAHEDVRGKELWLSPNFLYIRDAAAILLLLWITKKVINLGLQQDFIAIRSGLTGVDKSKLARWQDKRYEKFVSSWGSDPREAIRKTFARRGFLSPVVVAVHAGVLSLLSWDQLMSIEPNWYSTLFGPFLFMTGVYLAFSWNAMAVSLSRNASPLLKQKIIRPTLHDLGMLLFGFGIFWAYLFWAHYLTMWYGNLPEETGWIITRLRLEPWHTLAWFGVWCLFFFPFMFGLSREAKQIPPLLFLVGSVIALGVWLMFYIVIIPGQYPTKIPFSLSDIGITFGFLGVFALLAIRNLEQVPLIPFGDLYR